MNAEKTFLCKGDLQQFHKEWIIEECRHIAVDTETTGLNAVNDKLSTVQICAGKRAFIIQIDPRVKAKNLLSLLEEKKIIKVFHHAPFDLSFLMNHLDTTLIDNVVCTKIAFKLLHGIKTKSSLQELVRIYLNVSLDKSQRMSDWSKDELSEEQVSYALNDVRYLVELWNRLEDHLIEMELRDVAQKCFDYLPTQAYLSNKGIENIFKY